MHVSAARRCLARFLAFTRALLPLPHAGQRRTLLAALKRLNPRAQLVETTCSRVDIRRILGTRLFDLEAVSCRTYAGHSTAQHSIRCRGTAQHRLAHGTTMCSFVLPSTLYTSLYSNHLIFSG